MAEMTAKEYFKAKARMTGVNDIGACSIMCDDCLLSPKYNSIKDICSRFELLCPKEAIAIVQEWAKEHPGKTMLADFLEKYPNALLDEDGAPNDICPYSLGYEEEWNCGELKCSECWNRAMEE